MYIVKENYLFLSRIGVELPYILKFCLKQIKIQIYAQT
jgi:hypothetical protein